MSKISGGNSSVLCGFCKEELWRTSLKEGGPDKRMGTEENLGRYK